MSRLDDIAEQRFDNLEDGTLVEGSSEWVEDLTNAVETSPFFGPGKGYKVLDAIAELPESSLDISDESRSL